MMKTAVMKQPINRRRAMLMSIPPGCRSVPHRVLEHLGDAVIELAARSLLYELAYMPSRQADYFMRVMALVTNENLKSAGYASGTAAEIEAGCVFHLRGATAALSMARGILMRSMAWREIGKIRKDNGKT